MKINSLKQMTLLSLCLVSAISSLPVQAETTKEKLGRLIFNDRTLSRDGTQACGTCHNPARAFIDARRNLSSAIVGRAGAVSLGQDEVSLGDRNAPSVAYSAFIPSFQFDSSSKRYKGGMFWDGRTKDAVSQATQPFFNSIEMQTTKTELLSKVQAKYGPLMMSIYGVNIFSNQDNAIKAIGASIVAYAKLPEVSPFNAKFDRYLAGKEKLSDSEQNGLALFQGKAQCAICHTVPSKSSAASDKLFSNFGYANLGLPKNTQARTYNGKSTSYVDNGLYDNPSVTKDNSLKGQFRIPSLRNVALTAPYMHNGVFNSLEAVVQFYNTRDVAGALNPETHSVWGNAEVSSNKIPVIGNLKLSSNEVSDIVSFMRTLSDTPVALPGLPLPPPPRLVAPNAQ